MATRLEPLAHRSIGDVGNLHGGARHVNSFGGAAVHRGQRVSNERRGNLGSNQLLGRKRDRAAGQQLLRFVEDPPYIRNARPGRIDAWGLGLLAIWLGCLQVILDKGQEDDWFGAIWIRWATLILIVSFVLFLVRQLLHAKPLVDLTIFKNRNFTIGCLLIALFGAAIYGMVTLLPLFYQELMGYTAQIAGIAVSPRGLGAICAMPIIGILTTRMDNRWLIGSGFAIFAFCSLRFGEVNLFISQWSFLWAIILCGFGSGMVFVPLSTTTMGTLANEQIGNDNGVYNLSQNVG